jgi:hypothetical protein
LGILEKIREMKADANARLYKAAEKVPLPDSQPTGLALDLAKRARSNLESCKCDFKEGRYAAAAESLQQAVEKTSKAFGLLTGTAKPNLAEMKKIGHKSYLAFLRHFSDYYPKMRAMMEAQVEIFESPIFENPGMKSVGKTMQALAQKNLDEFLSVQDVDAQIRELEVLKPEDIWRPALLLDQDNQ